MLLGFVNSTPMQPVPKQSIYGIGLQTQVSQDILNMIIIRT